MLATELRAAVREVGLAVRRPEELATRWRDRLGSGAAPTGWVFIALGVNAVLGIAAYGLTMGFAGGVTGMISSAVRAPVAAGTAWLVALPALFVVNSVLGSRLDASTTALAALVTVSFGSLAMLASVPVSWFFSLALGAPAIMPLVHFVVFAGVGVAMVDVFMRVMKAVEPEASRAYPAIWLALVGVLGAELMSLLGVFQVR